MKTYNNIYDTVFAHKFRGFSLEYINRIIDPLKYKIRDLSGERNVEVTQDFNTQMQFPYEFIIELVKSSDDCQFNYHMSKDVDLMLKYEYSARFRADDLEIPDVVHLHEALKNANINESSFNSKEYDELKRKFNELRVRFLKTFDKGGLVERLVKQMDELNSGSKTQSIPVNLDIVYRLTGLKGYIGYKFKALGTLTKKKDHSETLKDIDQSIVLINQLMQDVEEFEKAYFKFTHTEPIISYSTVMRDCAGVFNECLYELNTFKKILELDASEDQLKEIIDIINKMEFEHNFSLTANELEYLSAANRKKDDSNYPLKLSKLESSLYWVRRLQAIIDLDEIGPRQLIVSGRLSNAARERLASINIDTISIGNVAAKINPDRQGYYNPTNYITLNSLASEYRKVGLDESFAKEIVAAIDPIRPYFKQSMGNSTNDAIKSLVNPMTSDFYLGLSDDELEDFLKAQQKRIKNLVNYCQGAIDDLYPKYVKFKKDLEII